MDTPRELLADLLSYLGEDAKLHFNKIYGRAPEDVPDDKLIAAIRTVEQSLEHNNVEFNYRKSARYENKI